MSFITNLLTRAGLMHKNKAPSPTEGQEAAAAEPPEDVPEAAPSMQSVKLATLLEQSAALDAEREQALAASLGFDASFDEIYVAAGVSPAEGFSIEDATAMARTARAQGIPTARAQQELEARLQEAEVTPESLLADAAIRDGALDLYEVYLIESVREAQQKLESESEQILGELERLQTRLATLSEQRREIHGRLEDWRISKRQTEEDWAAVIGLLLGPAGRALIGGRPDLLNDEE